MPIFKKTLDRLKFKFFRKFFQQNRIFREIICLNLNVKYATTIKAINNVKFLGYNDYAKMQK